MDADPPEDVNSAPVVVIDDDDDSLVYLTTLLARRGIRCAGFGCPQEALRHIRARAVSVVVTDIVMPEVDGLELLGAIRDCRPDVAVIALTGYNQSYLKCMELLGAIAGIRKPVNPAALLSAIEGCLGPATASEPCES